MKLITIEHPDYGVAHPEDRIATYPCMMCLLVIRPDTAELVLLWHVGNSAWSVSRNTPNWKRHRHEIGEIEL